MADSVDPDQMPHSAASDLGLHCLQRTSCPNTEGYYGTIVSYFSMKMKFFKSKTYFNE